MNQGKIENGELRLTVRGMFRSALIFVLKPVRTASMKKEA